MEPIKATIYYYDYEAEEPKNQDVRLCGVPRVGDVVHDGARAWKVIEVQFNANSDRAPLSLLAESLTPHVSVEDRHKTLASSSDEFHRYERLQPGIDPL